MKEGEVETISLIIIMWFTTCWPYGFAGGKNVAKNIPLYFCLSPFSPGYLPYFRPISLISNLSTLIPANLPHFCSLHLEHQWTIVQGWDVSTIKFCPRLKVVYWKCYILRGIIPRNLLGHAQIAVPGFLYTRVAVYLGCRIPRLTYPDCPRPFFDFWATLQVWYISTTKFCPWLKSFYWTHHDSVCLIETYELYDSQRLVNNCPI